MFVFCCIVDFEFYDLVVCSANIHAGSPTLAISSKFMIILAWILAIISLAIIAYIFIKKFPVLANIDVDRIEAERQAELKRKILSDKFKRSLYKVWKQFWKLVSPLLLVLWRGFQWLYNKFINLKETYGQASEVGTGEITKKISVLFAEAQDLSRKGELSKAESKYIEIIGLDGHNYRAFELLAENYFERGNYEEAEQTLEHTIKLKEQIKKDNSDGSDVDLAKTFFTLGLIYQKLGNLPSALLKYTAAVDLESNNPKYLDKMVEICIMMKSPTQARQYCQSLEAANPGNKKLKEIKEKIRDLENKVAREVALVEVEQGAEDKVRGV